MISKNIIYKVRNWFATKGMECTPNEVRIALERNSDIIENISPEIVKSVREDTTCPKLTVDLIAFIADIKEGKA